MKNRQLNFLIAILLSSLFSCGEKKSAEGESSADSSAAVYTDSSTSIKLPHNKFIRTADLKFRVKNVTQSSFKIEDIIKKHNGYIASSQLITNNLHTQLVQVSPDSSLETYKYVVSNIYTIKVPVLELDATLKEIANEIEFLDNKKLKADDQSLQLIINKLAINRNQTYQNRLAKKSDNYNKNLSKTEDAEDAILAKQENSDAVTVSSLQLENDINWSTIQLDIYQRESIKQDLIANEKTVSNYEPPFYLKLWTSIQDGFYIIEAIVLGLFKIWGIILIGVIIILCFKKYYKINN